MDFTPQQKRVADYLEKGLPQSEIATLMGISRQRVHQIVQRISEIRRAG